MSRSRSAKQRSVFVVCKAGSDIHILVDTLQDLGLHTLNTDDILTPNTTIAATTEELIAAADIVCAVLDESNSPNVYYELGYAEGLGKPTVIIGTGFAAPFDLLGRLWVRVSLTDRKALSFQLKAFLENIDVVKALPRAKRRSSSSKRSSATSKLASSGTPASELEFGLLTAFEASPEIDAIVSQPRDLQGGPYIPDFAIWLTAEPRVIESPVIVEFKGRARAQDAISQGIDQLEAYARVGNVKTGLLIIANGQEMSLSVARLFPLVFVVGLDEVKRLLADGKLVEALRRERNRLAHSAG